MEWNARGTRENEKGEIALKERGVRMSAKLASDLVRVVVKFHSQGAGLEL